MDKQDFTQQIKETILALSWKMTETINTDKWVVVGKINEDIDYINVGEDKGLNDTAFAVFDPITALNAQVFEGKANAEKYGTDLYLKDGANRDIYMCYMKAFDFFLESTKIAERIYQRLTA